MFLGPADQTVQCTGLCHPNFAGPGKSATAQHESEARLSGSSKYTGPDQQYYNWGFLNQLTCTVKDESTNGSMNMRGKQRKRDSGKWKLVPEVNEE